MKSWFKNFFTKLNKGFYHFVYISNEVQKCRNAGFGKRDQVKFKTLTMIKRQKDKKILIEITLTDLKDLHSCLKEINDKICEGQEYQKGKVFTASYSGSICFLEKTDFIEKEIDGVFYRIFKTNKK